jgi:hypothetical protein
MIDFLPLPSTAKPHTTIMKNSGNTCAACGYRFLKLPQRAPSGGASHEICPACGFESGFTDDDQGITYEQWRERWVSSGCRWFSSSVNRPDVWNPMKDIHSMLHRKRPVVPPSRLKRAEELRNALNATKSTPAPKSAMPKPRVKSR